MNSLEHNLPLPPLGGIVHVSGDLDEVVITADPEGLRSLACVLLALADLDQRAIDMPEDAKEHLHLRPGVHLASSSTPCVIGRADFASGRIDDVIGAPPVGPREIREIRRYRVVGEDRVV